MFLTRRSGYYYVHYKDASGQWQKMSTRTRTKREALDFYHSFVPQVAHLTLEAFCKRYLAYSRNNHSPGTATRIEYVLNHFCAFAGIRDLGSIDTCFIEGYKLARLETVRRTTVNIELRHLKAFFQCAVNWNLLKVNPCKRVTMLRIPKEGPKYIEQSQVKSLIEHAQPLWVKYFILIAINTGMRRGEILRLQWKHIDKNRRLALVEARTAKNKRERWVPLNRTVMALLDSLPHNSPYILTNVSGGQIKDRRASDQVKRAIIAAGLSESLKLHSMRHSFCTWLLTAGVPIQEVQLIAGHSSIAVTEIYNHMRSDNLHHAVEVIPTAE